MINAHWVISIVAGITAGIWSWLAERRRIRAAHLEGYGDGWNACEAHQRAHCPDADPDEMFDAGYKCGLEINVLRQPQSDDWHRGFKMGFDLGPRDCPRCTPKVHAVN